MNIYSENKSQFTRNLWLATLFLVVCWTWGSTWLGIKVAVDTIPPLTAAGLRFLVAFPFFFVLAKFLKEPIKYPKQHNSFFYIVTIVYFILPYFFLNYGEQFVSSGLTSLLFSSMPVWIIIFSMIMLKVKVYTNQVIGIVIGFVSLFMVLRSESVTIDHDGALGITAIIAAALMHAYIYVYTKLKGTQIPVITYNTLPIGIAGFVLLFAGIILEDPQWSQFSFESILSTLYLGIIASAGGFLAYFYLLKKVNTVVLSFIFVIFPVFALVLSSWYEQQQMQAESYFFVATLLIGFAITKFEMTSLLGLKRRYIEKSELK
ncbi:DMT family transporter [Spartinivicinus ruber]|uniref:DMT family transporter n=1 Tax=Spartinivicinus ruber TaxID=2683272 RepID=UPI0013D4B931|nr:DMT family transporter [Spartinivicinus ruber]